MAGKNLHEGHRERLKKELRTNEFSDTTEIHRLLEALLFYGIPRKDTNGIAHELLEQFGSISGVLEASVEDLYNVKGMTVNAATLIKLILPLARRYSIDRYETEGYKFNSIDEIGEYLVKKHSGYNQEVFIVTTFKTDGTKVSCEVINKGSVASITLPIKDIVNNVLKHNQPIIIISHNHVNTNAVPSQDDIIMTQKLKYSLEQLGYRLIDHIIVAGNDFVSLAQSNEYNSLFIIEQ